MRMIFINTLSLCTLIVSGSSIAQTQKSLIGFQGLPWGSTIKIASAKFPNSQQKDVCKAIADSASNYESVKKSLNEENTSCQALFIDKYMVDGINFNLKLGFDALNKLSFVTLTYRKEQSLGDGYVLECTSVYDRMSRLLEARYGEHIGVINTQGFAKDYDKYSVKAWLPLPSEIWIANLSGDRLLKRLAEISKKSESDVCMVKIHYTKKVSNEALKL